MEISGKGKQWLLVSWSGESVWGREGVGLLVNFCFLGGPLVLACWRFAVQLDML